MIDLRSQFARLELFVEDSRILSSPMPAQTAIALHRQPESLSFTRIRRFGFACLFLYVLGSLLGGIVLGWTALHPKRNLLTSKEEHNVRMASASESVVFRSIEVTASDGGTLRAWFLRPKDTNGDVVLLLHGVTDNRLGMYGYGQIMLRNHYSVLLPDARAHGNSGGELATYGFKESDDIHHWVDWLQGELHPRCVFGFGESMGAAQILQSLTKESRFCAVAAESPFSSFREVAYDRVGRAFHTGSWLGRSFFRPLIDTGFLFARLKYGIDFEDVSPAHAVAASQVPVLLIHGMKDRNIPPRHSEYIQAGNTSHVVLWEVPGAVHTAAHNVQPKEFERRLLGWFAGHSVAEESNSKNNVSQ